MKLHLISIGKNLPAWVNTGYAEYAKRLPKDFTLELIEIPASKRGKNSDIARLKQEEGQKLLQAIPKNSLVITLDEHGKIWSTQEMAQNLQKWHDDWQHVSLLIGGPDGLSAECLKQAHASWSLSKLTFPHLLIRIIVAEQLYRAWSVLQHHPYHR